MADGIEMAGEHEKPLHADEGTLKAFIRQVVREEMERILAERQKTRGWVPLRPGPKETK